MCVPNMFARLFRTPSLFRPIACKSGLFSASFSTAAPSPPSTNSKPPPPSNAIKDPEVMQFVQRLESDVNFAHKFSLELLKNEILAESLVKSVLTSTTGNGRDVFKEMDEDRDGVVTRAEFFSWIRKRQWVAQEPIAGRAVEGVRISDVAHRPNNSQLWALSIASLLPFIGFGFLDNFLMIIFGTSIEENLGVVLSLSTMAAAGLGNLLSDVAGIWCGSFIEVAAGKFGLAPPKLTYEQRHHRSSRVVVAMSSAVGITIGCLLGMIPLMFMDNKGGKIRDLFEDLDREKRGYLTFEDIKTGLRRLGFEVDDEQLATFFTKADLDKNGKVDYQEFKQIVSTWKNPSPKK